MYLVQNNMIGKYFEFNLIYLYAYVIIQIITVISNGGNRMTSKRYSRQRDLILHTVKHTNRHPTAEMIYDTLKAEHPGISLGTIYRNLNYLSESGQLLRLNTPVARFDGNTTSHPHFRCDICGAIYDLPASYQIASESITPDGIIHSVSQHQLIIYGTCSHCAEKC